VTRQLRAAAHRAAAHRDDDDGYAAAKFSESDQWDIAVLPARAAAVVDDVRGLSANASWRRRPVGGCPRRSDDRSRSRWRGGDGAWSTVSLWK